MIEFKADCGHTIRAKDENAGKVVRCSYCGREAQVPDEQEDQLDFLLNEVEATGEFEPPGKKRTARARPPRKAATPMRPRGDFNPFAVSLKMCYAALIITAVIVAGKYGYKQWHAVGRSGRTVAKDPGPDEKKQAAGPGSAAASGGSTKRGLVFPALPQHQSGIFCNSVPVSANVYVRCAREGSEVPILKDPNLRYRGPTGRLISLPPERYEVAVAVKITSAELMGLPGYREKTRPKLDDPQATEQARIEALAAYFLPDRAVRTSIETLSDYSRVVVRHYEVEVVRESWTPETALFLPQEPGLAELINYLPKRRIIALDDASIRDELSYWGVPEGDRQYIVDALSQVGMIPYPVLTEKKPKKAPVYRLFHVSVMDGSISTTLLN